MKIAMLYASHAIESWSTPIAIRDEFARRGHIIQYYNLFNSSSHYSSDDFYRLENDFLNGYKPDVIFCMDIGHWDHERFDKKCFPGVILVVEAGDDPQHFDYNVRKTAKVHMVLSPDRESVVRHQSLGTLSRHWTHHADHYLFYPRAIKEIFDCVTTCGTRGSGLTDSIKDRLGTRFNNERYFYGSAYAERLCMGKIVFQCSQYKEVTRRLFEGMSCGKMVLTDRLPEHTGINELFIDGVNILYYDSAQDAIDKIEYYATHDQERNSIAYNGFSTVRSCHTVKQRIDSFERFVLEISGKLGLTSIV